MASISMHRLPILNYPCGLAILGSFSQINSTINFQVTGKLETEVHEHLKDLIIHIIPTINVLRLY